MLLNKKELKFNQNFLEGKFGIEKETLRVLKDGSLVSTPHPIPTKFKNPHITVDFSEQQVEVISGARHSITEATSEIKMLTNIVYRTMNSDEYLWNYSIPFKGIKNTQIAYGDNDQYEYRKGLLKHSPYETQLISGIHFNWSLNSDITDEWSDEEVNSFYFNIFALYEKYSFVTTQMFGMSPTKNFKDYDCISYRQSSEGYNNLEPLSKKNKTYNEYRSFVNQMIKKNEIKEWREVHSKVRTKPLNAERIEWLEIRNIDLDYREEYGINEKALDFIHKFLLFLSFSDINKFEIPAPSDQFDFRSSIRILKLAKEWFVSNDINTTLVNDYLKKLSEKKYDAMEKLDPKKLISMQTNLKEKINQIPLIPIDDMELSTQILIEEAYKSGAEVDIIDKNKNIIKINGIILKQATLNPFDSKRGLEVISSKIKTNVYLKSMGINSTNQNIYKEKSEAKKDFKNFKNKKIVIKPVNTNFSKGLTVLDQDFLESEFESAIDFAFAHDNVILIEDFVEGPEYRFLVINDKVIGILLREPAHVTGDGKHSIKGLVSIKNTNPLRGENYKLPLEKIKLGKTEIDFLKSHNISPEDVPAKNVKVYLRKNSNVSTGGETIDVTEKVNDAYKDIALKATKGLDLKVCGLDIIIPDINVFKDYTILEMNWNPAIHIHTYPLKGEDRKPAAAIIKMIKENND